MKPTLPNIVLDSSAIFALLQNEAGKPRVKEILRRSEKLELQVFFSVINLGEVLYQIERRRGVETVRETLLTIEALPIEILPATRARVFAAAHIKANYTISYADAFAVAAAQEFDAPVLTGDPEFHYVDRVIRIEWLPQK